MRPSPCGERIHNTPDFPDRLTICRIAVEFFCTTTPCELSEFVSSDLESV